MESGTPNDFSDVAQNDQPEQIFSKLRSLSYLRDSIRQGSRFSDQMSMRVAKASVEPELRMGAINCEQFILARLNRMEIEPKGLNQAVLTA